MTELLVPSKTGAEDSRCYQRIRFKGDERMGEGGGKGGAAKSAHEGNAGSFVLQTGLAA